MNFARRLKRLQKNLAKIKHPSALLIETAPERYKAKTHDYYYPSSDFYYLTGSLNLRPAVLFFSNKLKKPLLLAHKPTKQQVVWEGQQDSPVKLAETLGIDYRFVKGSHFIGELKLLLKRHQRIYLDAAYPESKLLINALEPLPEVLPAEDLTSSLRLYKDADEIRLIKKAIKITHESLEELQSKITPGESEANLAAYLEYNFELRGAQLAFPSIVASGANAAILHYQDYGSKLKKNDLLLIDCGASYQGYSADITRCYPVSGELTGPYKDVHAVVLSAQQAAIKSIKDGVLIRKVYLAAAKELTIGLKSLGVLRGSIAKLMEKKAYLPYFMHSIGHSLGLDTHDPGDHRGNPKATLKKGMVFTVEPGLYFSKKTGKIPKGGVRIEDDVLVKMRGREVL